MFKFSQSIKIVVAIAFVANSAAFAVTDAASLQAGKISELNQRYESYNKRLPSFLDANNAVINFNNALSTAKKEKHSYDITLTNGGDMEFWGKFLMVPLVPSALAQYGLSFNHSWARNWRLPIYVGIVLAGVLIVKGYYMQKDGQDGLVIADADYDAAVRNIAVAKANLEPIYHQMDTDRGVIERLSTDLGAHVDNHIISFEGLNLQGLKVLDMGGSNSLNLRQLDMGNVGN